MRVVRKRIEKQVRGSNPGQVITAGWHAVGEYQSATVNTALLRFLAQIANNRIVGLLQPQHTVLGPAHDSHPAVEDRGQDLVAVVEGAEHESTGGQSELLAREVSVRDRIVLIEGEEAAGKIGDFLRVMPLLLTRHDHSVADQVVHESGSHGGRVAQEVDLDRSGSQHEDLGTAVGGVPIQIDRDVDTQLAGQGDHLQAGLIKHIYAEI